MSGDSLAVEMRQIRKVYGREVVANDKVDLDIKFGEVHSLLGENGAGKSTLMKILYGLVKPDSGEIIINGNKVNLNSPADAIDAGIGMVHQHFKLVPSLTVLENIKLSMNRRKVDNIEEKFEEIIDKFDLKIDKNKMVNDLEAHEQQMVEIMKLLCLGQKILIFDEPTSVLAGEQINNLIKRLKDWAKLGYAIIFISHKLDEVMEVSDRISVLRDGKKIDCVNKDETSRSELIKFMVGEEYSEHKKQNRKIESDGQVILKVSNLSVQDTLEHKKVLNDISFAVKKGEVFGIAGIQGNGQDVLANILAGIGYDNYEITGGEIILEENNITHLTADKIEDLGLDIGFIPPKAKDVGISNTLSVKENLLIRSWKKYGKRKINWSKVSQEADELIKKFNIDLPSLNSNAATLSGGNKIKIILARELSRDCNLIIIFDPCPGLDVKSINLFKKNVLSASENTAILLVTSELNLIFDLCDRLGVIYKGQLYSYSDKYSTFNKNNIINMMTGGI